MVVFQKEKPVSYRLVDASGLLFFRNRPMTALIGRLSSVALKPHSSRARAAERVATCPLSSDKSLAPESTGVLDFG
jgi:hypothetical protein